MIELLKNNFNKNNKKKNIPQEGVSSEPQFETEHLTYFQFSLYVHWVFSKAQTVSNRCTIKPRTPLGQELRSQVTYKFFLTALLMKI